MELELEKEGNSKREGGMEEGVGKERFPSHGPRVSMYWTKPGQKAMF